MILIQKKNIIALIIKGTILEYTFIDFFCGAGGFTEGFRQQGFKPIRGIENWQQAINTHNLNFGLNDKVKNVLDFEDDEEIEKLEDSHILLGSPPCVSFSMANKAGKADKSLGIRLIEAYLRVVAVKKHKKGSKLIAWYMENVPNSRNFVKESYTFKDLNLSKWAKNNNVDEDMIALKVKNNGDVLNSSHYGSPQKRERFICGEYIPTGEFLFPTKTHENNTIVLKDIKSKFPSPLTTDLDKQITDPNYPSLKIPMRELTDHFYDTGLYKIEWEKAKRAKVNHPFMGKMSFPENEDKPSRTIMATRAGSTRESIIYKSEYNRLGHGEFRLPTIREAATLMGFPYVFNFTGTESTKWKQIGNAVSPHMSFALAKSLKQKLAKSNVIEHSGIDFTSLINNNHIDNLKNYKFNNLNTHKEKQFDKIPKRKKGSKFRRHFFKGGNMTVSLMNHSPIDKQSEVGKDWKVYVFLGSGSKFQTVELETNLYKKIEDLINENLPLYTDFIKNSKQLCQNIPSSNMLQKLYEENNQQSEYLDVESFFEQGESLIEQHICLEDSMMISQNIFTQKENIPLFQLLSMYLISLYSDRIS